MTSPVEQTIQIDKAGTRVPAHILTPQPLEAAARWRNFPDARFDSKVDRPPDPPNLAPGQLGPCWEWFSARHEKGYGVFWLEGRSQQAHRVAWERKYGPIPAGLILLHKCDNPPCVRVDLDGPNEADHFFLGTVLENNTDRHVKGRTRAASGTQNAMGILNEDLVRQIRRAAADGKRVGQIAADLRISSSTVSRIVARKAWAHVED